MSPPGSGSLPSGTVTFLFTDIEGSTRLLQHLGDGYADVLAEHQRILREAFGANGGYEIDTQGDSFFVAFERARSAVAAAIAAQRGLAAREWPDGAQVKVRMGLHSGDPVMASEGYTGMGVHRAARISAAGHGGQVLLSNATRELVKDDLPSGVRLRDLGDVRLKDMDHTERVHQLIVDGLPADFPPLRTERTPVHRRRRVVAAAVATALVAGVGIALAAGGSGSGAGITVRANSLAAIDASTGKVVTQIPVGVTPVAVTAGSGALWVANIDDKTISRVDVRKGAVVKALPMPEIPTSLVAAGGGIWVSGSEPGKPAVALRRIDPQFNSLGDARQLGNVAPGNDGSVAARGRELWAAPSDGLLTKVDPGNARIARTIDPKTSALAIALGQDAIWIAGGDANTVTRVDPTGLVTPITVGHRPVAVAVGAGSVWAADALDDAVVRIDPDTNAVQSTIAVGQGPGAIAIGAGSVWVANSGGGTVSRIDPKTGRVAQTIRTGGSPNGLTVAGGKVWVTVAASEPEPTAASGGTLRLTSQSYAGPFDPALSYNAAGWTILYTTCVKLLNYPDKPAPEGSQLRPEAATALPAISDGGRTYTYSVRPGFRFSPPSNEPVTARSFARALERVRSPRMRAPGASLFKDVRSVVARGSKLVVRLSAPAPDLPARLATPFGCAVPPDTPIDPKGVDHIPMAGPYYITATPGPALVLRRNPNYHGTRPRRFAQIQLTPDIAQKRADALIEAGKSDFGLDGITATDYPRLHAKYAPRKGGAPRAQLIMGTALQTTYLLMNADRSLFADTALRRAVNYAIDRRALAALGTAFVSLPQKPTDQYLPPGMPGFRDVSVYPLTPDLVKAKQLAGRKRRHAILYSCNVGSCEQTAQVLKTELAAIGVDVEVRSFSLNQLFARLGRKGEPFDLALSGWVADYPDPDDFLDVLLLRGGLGVQPPFRDPRYVPALRAAAKLTGPRRFLTYGKLDAEIARNSAPWAAFANAVDYDFFSARVGCQVYQPLYGMDLAVMCIRKRARQ